LALCWHNVCQLLHQRNSRMTAMNDVPSVSVEWVT